MVFLFMVQMNQLVSQSGVTTMASYLLRNRYGNYYTRVPFPLKLKQLGFPHEFRISLLTKDRAIASFRNLMAAHSIKSLIEGFRVNKQHRARAFFLCWDRQRFITVQKYFNFIKWQRFADQKALHNITLQEVQIFCLS